MKIQKISLLIIFVFLFSIVVPIATVEACGGVSPVVDSTWKTYSDPESGVSFKYPGTWTFINTAKDSGIPGYISVGIFCPVCQKELTYINHGFIPYANEHATSDQLSYVDLTSVTELKDTGSEDRVFYVEAGANMAIYVLPKGAKWIPVKGKNPGWMLPSISWANGFCSLSNYREYPFVKQAVKAEEKEDLMVFKAILCSIQFAPKIAPAK